MTVCEIFYPVVLQLVWSRSSLITCRSSQKLQILVWNA